jgi:hypothetical protein
MPPLPQASSQSQVSFVGIMGIKGRNGSDPNFLIPEGQCLEAYNVDWYRSGLGRKRGGASSLSLATSGTAFANGAMAIGRHVPADDQTKAEFWALDGSMVFHRLAGGVTWADVTTLDACTGSPQEAVFQSFNGKLYICYKSAHNRLHVWDGTTLRRTGLDLPAQVVTIVLAAGAVTDTRKYRIAWTKQNASGVTIERSNLSIASAQQVLAAQQATVTRTTPPGEGETHWELYAASTSSAFGDYRLQATTVIGTTTAVDNAALGTTVAPADGANTPPPSARYMVADDARIILGGAYEAATNAENAMAPKNNRVWWTSILGASDVGDDERISNTGTINNYADLEEAITGISQPMQVVSAAATSLERGSFYVFSFENQWKFIATGVANTPYLKFRITGGGGCIHHKSIVTAIDMSGNPSIYWAAQSGMYRIGVNGQEFLGEDCVDIWETVNLDATIPCHTVYYRQLRQVWFYIATGSSQYPNKRIVFDTRLGKVTDILGVRNGWSLHEGESTKAYCSCMFSDSVGASMGRKLKPYIGYSGATAIWKSDTADGDDAGTLFQAYIDSKSYAPWGLDRMGGLSNEVSVIANPSQGVTIQLTIYRGEGIEASVSTADLTDHSDAASATKVFARFDNSRLADSYSFRCRVGDAQPAQGAWNLDAVIAPVVYEGDH